MKIKLGDICTFQSGGTPTKGTEEFFNGTIPWITTTALNGGKIDGTQAVNWITEKAIEKSAAKLVPAFSIMVGTRVGVGKVAVNTVQMSTSQDIISLINIDENRWDKDYLCKYIQGKNAFLNSQARGATIKGIKMDVLANLELEEITLENQARISETIDRVKVILDARKNELLELDKLVKARFIEMFGDPVSNPMSWEKRTLKEVCIKLNDGTHFSPESYETGQYKYVTAKNIKLSGFDFSNITYVPEEVHRPIYERCNPEVGDVLYIKDGATTGIAMVNTLEEEFTLLSSVALLKQDRSIMNGYFLTALLNNKDMYTDIRNNMGGAAITRLTIAKLNAINIIVPPIELQNQFADFVHQVDKSKLLEARQGGFIAKTGRQISFCR